MMRNIHYQIIGGIIGSLFGFTLFLQDDGIYKTLGAVIIFFTILLVFMDVGEK